MVVGYEILFRGGLVNDAALLTAEYYKMKFIVCKDAVIENQFGQHCLRMLI
jgi:hypothetical protein